MALRRDVHGMALDLESMARGEVSHESICVRDTGGSRDEGMLLQKRIRTLYDTKEMRTNHEGIGIMADRL